MEKSWQPSMKETAGNDILHKPGDASGKEATSRDTGRVRERGREIEEFGEGGRARWGGEKGGCGSR